MSLGIHQFELECDHEGCKHKLIAPNADYMLTTGWAVFKPNSDHIDRSCIEIGDPVYCPDHIPTGPFLTKRLV